MMADPRGNVTFLAVARTVDRVILASYAHGVTIDLGGIQALLTPKQMAQVKDGMHYNFGSGESSWHLMQSDAMIYIAISAPDYPVRHASALLEELKRTFAAKAGDKAKTAMEGVLTRDCTNTGVSWTLADRFLGLFQKLCIKYDDRSQIDNLNTTLTKIDAVKMIMQENIEIALSNCVSLEHIDKQADDLQAQAGMFKTRAKTLRSKMWWKLCKMRLLLAAIIIAIVIAIAVSIAMTMGAGSGKGKN